MKYCLQVKEILTDFFGDAPLKLERMNVGRINTVYSVALSDREVIVRINENPFVLKGTSRNISILRDLGLPVPRVIMEDLTNQRFPFHYMILEKIPGRDLRFELEHMTNHQITKLADTIVSFQKRVEQIPHGTGYGWVPIDEPGEFNRWIEVVRKDVENGLPNVQKELSELEIGRILNKFVTLESYLETVAPECFLDDVTTKNVIMLNGELQGIVDLDCVCYGDPLYMISLTQTAIVADLQVPELFYIDELCRIWGLTKEQREIVDFYSLVFAMNFLAYFKDDTNGYSRMLSYLQKWVALL